MKKINEQKRLLEFELGILTKKLNKKIGMKLLKKHLTMSEIKSLKLTETLYNTQNQFIGIYRTQKGRIFEITKEHNNIIEVNEL